MNMEKLFKCPDCNSRCLEEIMVNVTMATIISDLGDGGDAEYGEQSNDGGVIDRFQCMDCGWSIKSEVANTKELFDYLTSSEIPPGHVKYERRHAHRPHA